MSVQLTLQLRHVDVKKVFKRSIASRWSHWPIFILLFYAGLGGFPWWNANNASEPTRGAIEAVNSLWQSKVWRRYNFPDAETLAAVSASYIAAYRAKTAARREAAPSRRRFPAHFELDLSAPLKGTIIFVRRSNENGNVHLLNKAFRVDEHWPHRLVRCEIDFTHQRIRFYALRRRDPADQPLLRELPYQRSNKPFQGTP